jgi:hypothetical protein
VVLELHQKFLALVLFMRLVVTVELLELLVRLAQQILETVAAVVVMLLAHQRQVVQVLSLFATPAQFNISLVAQ